MEVSRFVATSGRARYPNAAVGLRRERGWGLSLCSRLPVERPLLVDRLGEPDGLPLCTADEIAALSAAQRALVDYPLMDDVAFVREMIAFLSANYSIDSKNISGTGFSNGGGFTSRLAVDMSEDFDALATAAGSLGLPGRATRPISMVVSFGAVDDRINASAGVHPLPMDESLETLTQFTERFVLPYLFALDLADEYAFDEQNVAGKNVVRFTYSTSNSGGSNEFQLVVLEYLAHQYPNKTNYPMAMADFLWDFFQSYTLQ